MLQLHDDDFQSKIDESKLIVIKMWAPWCGPCKAMAPAFAEMADMFSEDAEFAKINVDENSKVTTHFGVSGLPTILFLKNGQVVHTLKGAQPRPKLEKEISKFIEENA